MTACRCLGFYASLFFSESVIFQTKKAELMTTILLISAILKKGCKTHELFSDYQIKLKLINSPLWLSYSIWVKLVKFVLSIVTFDRSVAPNRSVTEEPKEVLTFKVYHSSAFQTISVRLDNIKLINYSDSILAVY